MYYLNYDYNQHWLDSYYNIFIFLILLSAYISREQKSKEDYFIAKRTLGPFKLSVSVIATQCSTNSIIGAPAFIAFASGGGLVWLQYELAIPLAMIFIMIFIFPIFYKLRQFLYMNI